MRSAAVLLALLPAAACTGHPVAPAPAPAPSAPPRCSIRKLDAFSTDQDEGRLSLSPDGDQAFFHRGDGVHLAILESHRAGDTWSPPVPAPFASGFDELDAYLTPDGGALYYASFRPVTGTTPRPDADLWKVERAGGGWGPPSRLGPEINTDANELFPSTTADGALYFNSDRVGGPGTWDLYRAPRRAGGYGPPEPLPGAVNTAIWEYNPSPSPDGRLLAFASLEPGPPQRDSNVFFARRVGDRYAARLDAGPCVNTAAEEYHPTLDLAGRRLIFVRVTPATGGDLYEVRLDDVLPSD